MLKIELFPADNGISTAVLRGELIGTEVPDVTESLENVVTGEDGRLIIDLTELSSLDSSGLAALIHLTNRARLTGGKLMLVGPSPFVNGVFRTTRLDTWFDIAPDMRTARMKLAGD